MDVNITPTRTSISHHVSPSDEVQVKGFAASTEGYGNPSFVTLQVEAGSYADGTRQSFTLFFTPEVAARLGGELTLASAEAICPEEAPA
jgi:hypothetical protein